MIIVVVVVVCFERLSWCKSEAIKLRTKEKKKLVFEIEGLFSHNCVEGGGGSYSQGRNFVLTDDDDDDDYLHLGILLPLIRGIGAPP